jgi:hypothetical protein
MILYRGSLNIHQVQKPCRRSLLILTGQLWAELLIPNQEAGEQRLHDPPLARVEKHRSAMSAEVNPPKRGPQSASGKSGVPLVLAADC